MILGIITVMTKRIKRFWIREPFCGFSHGLGALLSVAALVALLVLAHGKVWHTVSFAVFGVSLIVLYTASTLYHSLWVKPQQIIKLMRFDHVAIFLLIAGTYAPVCLVGLRGAWGWSLFGVEYGLAIVGIVCSLVWKNFPDWARIGIYLIMGWLIAIAMTPLHHVFPPAAVAWLFAGGIAYCVGTVVFATDRPHLWPGKFSAHDLWHIFVLAGSACHFVLMACFIARMG
jgi:hemolysin III